MSINKKGKYIFGAIVLAEMLSLTGHYFPLSNTIGFFVIVIAALILSLKNLSYGVYLILTELLVGSFGYLFYFETGGLKISLRQALWLIILSVWLMQTIVSWVKTKKLSLEFFKFPNYRYFLALFLFVGWGLLRGWVSGNSAANLFFDFNNWLYFLLIFPVFTAFKSETDFEFIKRIFLATVTWLSLKTILLFYIFSHDFGGFTYDVYRWVRESGVGEITRVQGGFFRVFLQSQIFILIAFFLLPFYYLKETTSNLSAQNKKIKYFILNTLFLSAILISFSRSFWLGAAAGLIFLWLIIILKLKSGLKLFLIFNLRLALTTLLSLVLCLAVLKFPVPAPFGGFNPADLLNDRLTQSEAGASSRWQLLSPLWQKIKLAPVLGQGFGATVTYRTADPRILASNPTGYYTTYAFEWGWLDVWLKLGLLGLIAYLALLAKLIYDGLRINSVLSLGLITGLFVLAATNMFSPYVNHPLGIGYLIITAAVFKQLKTEN